MKNTYTLQDFEFEEIISTETGFWAERIWSESGGVYTINYSAILTKLIQIAGRICVHYASDLFITWKTIDKYLHDKNFTGGRFLFGFREMGVDGYQQVLYRYNEGNPKAIKELYMLDIEVCQDTMTMTFGEARLKS